MSDLVFIKKHGHRSHVSYMNENVNENIIYIYLDAYFKCCMIILEVPCIFMSYSITITMQIRVMCGRS